MEILFAGFRKKIGTDSPTLCAYDGYSNLMNDAGAMGHAIIKNEKKKDECWKGGQIVSYNKYDQPV